MATKTEVVWRHLLVQALEHDSRRTTLQALAEELDLPVTTVHKALERPREIGVLRSGTSGLRTVDPGRLLLLLAARRDLRRDVVYETHVPTTVREIESRLPATAIPTAYTAYVAWAGRNTVADYEQVVTYGDRVETLQRFPPRRGPVNLIVLEPDPWLATYGANAPLPQLYADLFNLSTWQAQRFLAVLNRRVLTIDAA